MEDGKEVIVKPEKKVSKKAEPKVAVKVISTNNKAALIEQVIDNKIVRKIVPNHLVIGGKVTGAVFDAGMPYGVDWSEFEIQQITPEALHNELINNGIWTYDDARKNPIEVQFAIIRLANLIRAKLMEFARNKKT